MAGHTSAVPRSLPVPVHKPTVHDMRGNMGYPVLLIAMNDDWREILVEHYSRKVKTGDQMIVGHDALTCRTYWVVKNAADPKRPNAWLAHLEVVAPPPVTIAGQTYC